MRVVKLWNLRRAAEVSPMRDAVPAAAGGAGGLTALGAGYVVGGAVGAGVVVGASVVVLVLLVAGVRAAGGDRR